MKIPALFFALALAAAPTLADCRVPAPAVGHSYHASRAALILAGWYPVLNPRWLDASPARLAAQYRQPARWGYLEMIDCAGTGAAPCLWRWMAPDGAIVDVTTAGDEYTVTGSDCYRPGR